jgi:hypothetical protein
VETVFRDEDSVMNSFKDRNNICIVGIDLGEVCTAAACAININGNTGMVTYFSHVNVIRLESDHTNAVKNLVVKRACEYTSAKEGKNSLGFNVVGDD